MVFNQSVSAVCVVSIFIGGGDTQIIVVVIKFV